MVFADTYSRWKCGFNSVESMISNEEVYINIGYHLIYCTHCNRAPWKVPAKFTTTSAQLRHLRKRHPRLPTTQEAENARIHQLESTSTGVGTLATPFSLATV